MKKLFLIVVSLVYVSQSLHCFNVELLKGTHTVLSDWRYAPFWGLTFIECDLAKQWYKWSASEIVEGIQDSLAKVSEQDKAPILKLLLEQENTLYVAIYSTCTFERYSFDTVG